MVSWLAPGGWMVLEEADFGMWIGDADPVWATPVTDTRPRYCDPDQGRRNEAFTASARPASTASVRQS